MKTNIFCLAFIALFIVSSKIEASVNFNFITPPSTANICNANQFKIGFYDVVVSNFPLTVNINSVVKQGNNIVSLSPFPDCGVGIPNTGISPVQLINGTLINPTCQLALSTPTINQGTYTYTISIVSSCSGSVSFDLYYDVILDCSLIPQNFLNIQNLTLDQTCSVAGDFKNLMTIVPIPHLLNAPTITVPGNNGQTSDMIFIYQNNGYSDINLVFSFEDLYKSICGTNSAYTTNGPIMYGTGSIPTYTTALVPGIQNTATIIAGQYLYIKQTIAMDKCNTNCPNDRKVKFVWQCANNLQNYQFCDECQQEYVTQFVFSSETPSFTVERISPLLNDVIFNTQCFNDEQDWQIKVTNTSPNTTLPYVKIRLKNESYGIAGLVVIYHNSIGQDPDPVNTNCPSCSLNIISSNNNTNSACHGGPSGGISYGTYDIEILGGIKPGEYITFIFKTIKCCNSSTSLIGVNKAFNHWKVVSSARTICNNYIGPSPSVSGNDLSLSALVGNISTHFATGTDINLGTSFVSSYPWDYIVPTNQGIFYSSNTTNQTIEFTGMFGDDFDKQIFGYTTSNPNTSGILKAKIHCEKGLVVCDDDNISLEYTQSGTGLQVAVPLLWYYSPNGAGSPSPVNPNACPSCIESDYSFYYLLSDIEDGIPSNIDDFFASAKFNFNLTPCCEAEPVTDYDVTFSILPNSNCFNYTLTSGSDLTCIDNNSTPGEGCCWLPLNKEGYHINVHCPGCRAPGIIVDDYRIRRNSFGFPDVTNNRVADNTTTITPLTLAAYEALIAPKKINRDASVYGDELIDRLTAHFEPGDATMTVSFPCSSYYRGYTYSSNAGPCNPTTSDMRGMNPPINLDILQLHRTIPNSSSSDFDLKVLSAELYFDEPCSSCNQCIECGEFDLIQANSLPNWSTQFKMTIPGYILNTSGNAFLETGNDELLFSFHEDDIKNPPSGVIISTFNGGMNVNFDFQENQQYRLVVKYQVCGNKYSTSLFYPDNADIKFVTEVINKMWLTGGSTTGSFPNGFNLANHNGHPAMPNVVYDLSGNPGADMEDDLWALVNNPSYCNSCMQINQNFADGYKFYCETCSGTHTFYSTDITTKASYANANNPAISCEKSITITAINSFARNKFETGATPKDLFPYEFRPPALFPYSWNLDIPLGYTQSSNVSKIWSNYFIPNNAWWGATTLGATIPQPSNITFSISPLVFNQSNIGTPFSNLSCIQGTSVPANNSLSNLLVGDNMSSQSIQLFFEPDCNINGGIYEFQATDATIEFRENSTNCNSTSTPCSYVIQIDNMDYPRSWDHPNPNLDVDFAPSNTDAFTQQVCWPFTITNFDALPLPNQPDFTDAYNIFIAVPDVNVYTYLTGWTANYSYNNATYISNANGSIIGLWPNGGTPSDFPLHQNSIISGEVCAQYNPCQGTPANNYITPLTFNTGWNCDGFPVDLNDACNQNYESSNVTLTDKPVYLTVDNLVVPPNGLTICDPTTSIISAEFTNVDLGTATFPAQVNLLGSNFNISNVKIFNCVTGIESPSLAGGGSNFTITSTELNAIGWLDYIMGKNECIGIKVEFTANCPNSGGMFFQLPIIEFVPTSYCGLPVSSKANFLPVPITSSMCSNCFGITKTISPQPAIAGQQVTYTINVYGLNAAGPSINITVDDIFPPPPNFTMSPQVIFPMTVTVPAFGNYPINVTGIFNNLNTSCPATNFTNTATLLPSGPSAEVCAIVTCPLPTPNDFHVTNTDYVASSVFSGVNPPTGSIIFVDDYVNLEIDMNMIFDNCTFIMGSGSSIDVLTGFTLIFNHNTVLYSCPQMWQGIIIRSGASIDVNNSIIKDADRGIYVEHDALFRVINSQILDCVSGIFTEDYGSTNNTIGYVAGTTFKLDNLALKGSYNGQDPHGSIGRAGMVLNNIALMTVGDNGASENLFEKLNFGIEIHNSNIDVTNCRFETITPDNTYLNIGILKPLGCAITARQDQEGFYYLNSFPLANTAITTISNAIVGVYTNLFNARINSVTMDNVVRGIVSENSPQRIVVAMGCEINATYRGIDWYDNDGSILMFAQNNNITVLPIGPGLTKQSACISMTELSATAQANYEVSYNPNLTTISAGAGIWANTVNNALIEGNIINTTEDVLLPAPGSAGIALIGGSRCTVLCNTVNNTIPSTNLVTTGIYTSQSSDNTFDCNNLYYSARGMYFSGSLCFNTVMKGNKMDNNYIGLYLDNTAVISQQPVIPPPPDPMPPFHGNEWTPLTFGSGYGAVNMNAPPYGNPQGNFINRFTIRDPASSGGLTKHLPVVPNGIAPWPDNSGWFDLQNTGSTFECSPSPGVSVCGGSIAGGGDEKLEEELRLSIVQDSSVSVEYIPESKSLAKQYVYAELSTDSTLLTGNSVYQNFKNVNSNTAIGKLFGVKTILKQKGILNEPDKQTIYIADSMIQVYLSQIKSLDSLDILDSTLNFSYQRAGLVSSINIQFQGITSIRNQLFTADSLVIQNASFLNNQVVGGELPQTNEKFVNTKTLQYYLYGISALTSDFPQLLQIAMQCPAAGGPSVYTARGLVEMLTDSIVYDDESVCLQSGYYRVANNSHPRDKSDLEVIPNPASESVDIILKNAPEGICRVRFISTLGRLTFVKQFSCTDKSLSVDVSSFPPGIYYVETMMPESLFRITKLVIVR